MTDMIAVLVPMENVNDEALLLVRWLVAHGDEVREGQAIAELETSKAVVELVAPGSGTISLVASCPQEVEVGSVVAYLNAAPQSTLAVIEEKVLVAQKASEPEAAEPVSSSLQSVRFSKKALELIDRNGLSKELFATHAMVREADVLAVLQNVPETRPQSDDLHFAVTGISLAGVTLPKSVVASREGKLDPEFVKYLHGHRDAFSQLSSADKCDEYRKHGAVIGADVELGKGTMILSPQLVLRDRVQIGDLSSVECSERFVVGELSSFRAGLSVQGSTVVVGENVFGCYRIEISGGVYNPWSVLYVGDNTFIGDDAILDIGKEAFVTQRSTIITHNIGHSILEGYENRFESVVLEDYCQVGMNSTIYAGSRIGSSAIVASNSYVISSIPAGKLAIGVPARVVRDAARPPSREQQVQIAYQMLREYREWLGLKGLKVTEIAIDRFTLEFEDERVQLVFAETYTGGVIGLASCDQCILWTLRGSASPPRGCALFDLLAKTVEGESGVFVDTTREFLRKRGIRFQPGPWRYRHGFI
jgi:acetyltransferase-like isoleucine patch superfamily enzyme